MRLPWQPEAYERECADCGYTWQVPRQFAQKRVKSTVGSLYRGRRGGIADPAEQRNANMARLAQAETFRHCPKCTSTTYAQRPAR